MRDSTENDEQLEVLKKLYNALYKMRQAGGKVSPHVAGCMANVKKVFKLPEDHEGEIL